MRSNFFLKPYLIPVVFFLIIFLINLSDLLNADFAIGQWDAITRVRLSVQNDPHYPSGFSSTTWLPLHLFIIRVTAMFTDSMKAHIVINFLIYCSTFLIFIKLALKKYKNHMAVVALSFILIAFSRNSLFLALGLTTHSEVLFLFFLTLALYFFEDLQLGDRKKLFYFLMAITCANLVRYEAWIISIGLVITYFIKNKNIKSIISMSPMALVPIVWIFITRYFDGIWFRWLSVSVSDGKIYSSIFNEGVLRVLLELFFPCFLIIIVLSIPLALIKKSYLSIWKHPAFISFILILSFLVKRILQGELFDDIRYLSVVMFLWLWIVVSILVKNNIKLRSLYFCCISSAILILLSNRVFENKVKSQTYIDYRVNGFIEADKVISELELNSTNRLFLFRALWYTDLLYTKNNFLNTDKVFWPRDEFLVDPSNTLKNVTDFYSSAGLFKTIYPTYVGVIKIKRSWAKHYFIVYEDVLKNNYQLYFQNNFIKLFKKKNNL